MVRRYARSTHDSHTEKHYGGAVRSVLTQVRKKSAVVWS